MGDGHAWKARVTQASKRVAQAAQDRRAKLQERNEVMAQARAAGAKVTELAEWSGLTRQAVHKALGEDGSKE